MPVISHKPKFFATQSDFRKWLEKHHDSAQELWVGYYKRDSGKESITWPQSVDEALCFGWIDGVRKSIDEDSYTIRFTPRRRTSNWSAVNIKRARELKKLGLMMPSGVEAFEKRDKNKAQKYSFERKNVTLARQYERSFRANKKAWEFFLSLAPSTRRPSIWWIMSAKKEETRLKRLDILISSSAAEQLIPPMRFAKGR